MELDRRELFKKVAWGGVGVGAVASGTVTTAAAGPWS
jgi:hypothetical protein